MLACIYRSPESDFYEFLNKLEVLIRKVYSKGKCLILCGDWNVNFLHQNGKLQNLQNLLLMNNLINIIELPTRVTSHSKSLIDVVIVNNSKEKRLVEVLDMGYSDHLAQYVCMKLHKAQEGPNRIYKRQFTNTNVEYLKHLLYDEKWMEVVESDEPNSSFMSFINIFTYYFNVAFPVEIVEARANHRTQRWITKGLIVSRNKLRTLREIKRRHFLSVEFLEYIQIYQRVFRKVLNEARRKESDRYVMAAKNKSKALWNLINKESGKSQQNQNIMIKQGQDLITNPRMVAASFNRYFTEVVENLVLQRNKDGTRSKTKSHIQRCTATMFVAPVTVQEM
jgi:hypothetical protein